MFWLASFSLFSTSLIVEDSSVMTEALPIMSRFRSNFERSSSRVYFLIISSSSFRLILPIAWLVMFSSFAIEVSDSFALPTSSFRTFFSFLVSHILTSFLFQI